MMSEKVAYIAACGIPSMIVEGCNAIGLPIPVRAVDPQSVANIRPEGWILSAEVFVSNLDVFLPYRRHIIVCVQDSKLTTGGETFPALVETSSGIEDWIRALEMIVSNGSPFGTETNGAPLSNREKEVIRLVASGLTAKEIAERLGISVNTVVTHRKNISSKLGIRSASGLSLYAMMNGLI